MTNVRRFSKAFLAAAFVVSSTALAVGPAQPASSAIYGCTNGDPCIGTGGWIASAEGGVYTMGDATFHGSAGNIKLNSPIVGMAPTPAQSSAGAQGYWLVAADGGVFSFNAPYHGSTGNLKLNSPIVGMQPTSDGMGYWLVAADGGVFSFGTAEFYGSMGASKLNQPVVGIGTDSDEGYWLVAADGGIFSFGDRTYKGGTGAMKLNEPIVGMAVNFEAATDSGYWLLGRDGGVFTFGDASFHGAPTSNDANDAAAISPIYGVGEGYNVAKYNSLTKRYSWSTCPPADDFDNPNCMSVFGNSPSKIVASAFFVGEVDGPS